MELGRWREEGQKGEAAKKQKKEALKKAERWRDRKELKTQKYLS